MKVNFTRIHLPQNIYILLSEQYSELVMLVREDHKPCIQQLRRLLSLERRRRGRVVQHVVAVLTEEKRHVRGKRVTVRHPSGGLDIANTADALLLLAGIHAARESRSGYSCSHCICRGPRRRRRLGRQQVHVSEKQDVLAVPPVHVQVPPTQPHVQRM